MVWEIQSGGGGGGQKCLPSVGGVCIFSGTTQFQETSSVYYVDSWIVVQ